MTRILSLFVVFMLGGVLAFSQTRTVTGKVTDKNGNAIPFATIKVRSSKLTTAADVNGTYSVKAKEGDVIDVTATGYDQSEVSVSKQSTFSTILALSSKNVEKEVIITSAFNSKRTARSVSSNAQVVGGEQLNIVRPTNINNALAGKVAGIQVRSQSSAALGKETNIRVRGESNAGGGGSSPIYVVDGTIIASNNDINSDDVESLTVLQGPQGAAMFGPDGANGAIVITTKRAKKGAPGIGLEINTGVQFDNVYLLPKYQDSYGGGGASDFVKFTYQPGMPAFWQNLDGKYLPDYSDDASWGPRLSGQEYIPWYAWYPNHDRAGKTANWSPNPNNVRDFFNTGINKLNNVNFSKATENGNIRLSYTNTDITGIITNSYLKKHNFNINSSQDFGSHVTFSSNITYLTQKSNAENDDAYSNNSTGNFNSWYHRDLDNGILRELQNLKTPDGTLASWNKSGPASWDATNPNAFYKGNYWFNPYTYFNNISNINQRDRIFGDLTLLYKVNNDLSFRGTYRKQQLTTNEERIINNDIEYSAGQASINNMFGSNASGTTASTNNGKAFYGTRQTYSNRNTFEAVVNFKKTFKNFQLNTSGGLEVINSKFKELVSQTLGGLTVLNLYTLDNSKNSLDVYNYRSELKRNGVFVRGDLGWKNMLFAEFVVRKDRSSALPVNSSVNSRNIGGSFVFSDLTKNQTPWLSFGKLRASYGEVTRLLSEYQLNVAYTLGAQNWTSNGVSYGTMGVPNTSPDPGLKGAKATTIEFGIDLKFLKNRVGISATYYKSDDSQSPISGQVSGSSGVGAILGNFGGTLRRGIDLQLNVKPIVSKNFTWELNATYSKQLENKITQLAPGVEQLTISAGNGGSGASFTSIITPIVVNKVGEQWGQLYGGTYARSANGSILLDSVKLLPKKATDLGYLGSVLPDYTGGVQNTFTIFKNFIVNINIDYQVGGKYFSLSDMWGSYSGLLARTATTNDKGNPIRDDVADGGGVKVVGINEATGKEVTRYVDAQTYFHAIADRNIFDDYVYDLGFVKLREFSLGYRLPVEKLGLGKVLQNATFSVVARNPLLIYSKNRDFDPSEISGVYGENGQLPGTRSIGVNLRLGF